MILPHIGSKEVEDALKDLYLKQNVEPLVDLVTDNRTSSKQEVIEREPKWKREIPEEVPKKEVVNDTNGDEKCEEEEELQKSSELEKEEVSFKNEPEDDNIDDGYDGFSSEVEKHKSKDTLKKQEDRKYLKTYIDDLSNGNKTLGQEGMFACKLCQKTFSGKDKVKKHLMRVHKMGAKFNCEVCGRAFVYERDMEKHVKLHGDDKPFVCDLCGADFKTKVYLYKHTIYAHGTKEENEKLKKYICSICSKKWRSAGELKEHEKAHSNKRDILCTQCHKGFNFKSVLRNHMKIHHGDGGHTPKKKTEEDRQKHKAYMVERRAAKKAQNGGVLRNEEERKEFNEYMRQWNAKKRLQMKKSDNDFQTQ